MGPKIFPYDGKICMFVAILTLFHSVFFAMVFFPGLGSGCLIARMQGCIFYNILFWKIVLDFSDPILIVFFAMDFFLGSVLVVQLSRHHHSANYVRLPD